MSITSISPHVRSPGRSIAAPLLSVIVPTHDSAARLDRVLDALVSSDLPRECWELIVVDDASSDGSALVASHHANLVVRLPAPARGPSYARNRGFEVSRGAFVAFVDADVRVHPDTLRRLVAALADDSEVAAVCGAYDAAPEVRGHVSTYRNLLRHFEQTRPGGVRRFWAGCCAIRRSAMESTGLFNEWHFTQPQVEGIELAGRIRAAGLEVRIDPTIQATHLKEWTLASFLKKDLRDRRIAEMRVLRSQLRATESSAESRRRIVAAWAALATWIAITTTTFALISESRAWLLGTALALGFAIALDWPMYRFFGRLRGPTFAVRVIGLRVATHAVAGVASALGLLLHHVVGEPRPDPTIEAFAEVGVQTWPPIPSKQPTASPLRR